MESGHKGFASSINSEKFAVRFGLMRLRFGTAIRVFKNRRICGDFHNYLKFISKVVKRGIIVRDGREFHYFGSECFCSNYR